MKNKIGIVIFTIISIFISTFTFDRVSAAGASISVKSSKSTLVVGGSFNVTVTVYSSASIGAWEYNLMYDTSKFQLVSGTQHIVDYASGSGKTTATYNYTLRAKAAGTGKIYIQNSAVADWNENTLSVSNGSTSVKVITQAELEASYSKNNYLSSLSVDGASISPAFNKDTLEYSVELEPETTNIKVNATKEDSKASVSGIGDIAVSEGDNQIKVTVTAENGSQRVYTINAKVKELSPINVKVDKEDMTVVRKKDVISEYMPSTYKETSVKIGEEEVPAFTSDITKFILVGLKDNKGSINLYIYDSKNNSYTQYNEINSNKVIIYPIAIDKNVEIPDGYSKYSIKIGEKNFDVYKLSKGSHYSLIYGMNVETGKKNLYLYDSKEETLQRYYSEELEVIKEKLNLYNIIIISSLGVVVVLCIILIILSVKIIKKRNTRLIKQDEFKLTKKDPRDKKED